MSPSRMAGTSRGSVWASSMATQRSKKDDVTALSEPRNECSGESPRRAFVGVDAGDPLLSVFTFVYLALAHGCINYVRFVFFLTCYCQDRFPIRCSTISSNDTQHLFLSKSNKECTIDRTLGEPDATASVRNRCSSTVVVPSQYSNTSRFCMFRFNTCNNIFQNIVILLSPTAGNPIRTETKHKLSQRRPRATR
jgi:hypothetical protein